MYILIAERAASCRICNPPQQVINYSLELRSEKMSNALNQVVTKNSLRMMRFILQQLNKMWVNHDNLQLCCHLQTEIGQQLDHFLKFSNLKKRVCMLTFSIGIQQVLDYRDDQLTRYRKNVLIIEIAIIKSYLQWNDKNTNAGIQGCISKKFQ